MTMEQKQEQPRYRLVTVHSPSLTHALSIAMTRTAAWRDFENGDAYSLKDLYEFAKRHDKEYPLEEPKYYIVSLEGAIGISPGLEWLTTWMFVPMEPGEERDRLMQQMKHALQYESAVRDNLEKKVLQALKAEKEATAKGTPPPPPPPPPPPRL